MHSRPRYASSDLAGGRTCARSSGHLAAGFESSAAASQFPLPPLAALDECASARQLTCRDRIDRRPPRCRCPDASGCRALCSPRAGHRPSSSRWRATARPDCVRVWRQAEREPAQRRRQFMAAAAGQQRRAGSGSWRREFPGQGTHRRLVRRRPARSGTRDVGPAAVRGQDPGDAGGKGRPGAGPTRYLSHIRSASARWGTASAPRSSWCVYRGTWERPSLWGARRDAPPAQRPRDGQQS